MIAQQAGSPRGMPPRNPGNMPPRGPGAGPMPGGGAGPMPNPAGQQSPKENPLLEAFRTIFTMIAAKIQEGDPNATAMQDLMRQFVGLIGGQDAGNAPMPGQGPPQQGGGQQVPVGRGGINPNAMNGTPVGMRGKVQVM